ncbi:MAG: DUF4832 domain-containing protein [Bacteroidales bacterium]|nr:DUF4832 domain-containing protein [Bacteroidales bacterium]
MMKRLFLLMALILGSCACEEKPTPTPTPIPEPEPEPTPVEEAVRVSFQSEITHVQPMTGIVLWNTSGSVKKDYVQLEYSYMLYNDVCKEKDVFDWTPMDKLLEQVAARGHQAVVRFRYTYPGYASAVPDYIKKMDGYEAIWAKADGRSREDTEYPDWRCEELRRFHMEFHRRFAERYDKDPRLAFVETGFGHWAEYHVYDGKYIDGQTFPSKEFQAEFLPKMDEWFKETPWLISIDASDSKYAPFRKQKELLDLNFGNFDDSFMCEDWDGYNWSCWTFFGKERYKKAPAGGEFSYYSSYDQKHVLDKEGMYGRVFEDVVAKVHMTFIIGNDQPGKQKPERITEAAMSMGYRFEVRDFKVLEGKSAEVLIANVGVAPIYRDAFVEVEGVRGDLNLRTLMPGDEALVTIACEAKTSSRPAIACDHLVEGQEIQYQADIKE